MEACAAWRRSVRSNRGPMPADTELRVSRFAELAAGAVVAGHREEQKRQLLGEVSRRLYLMDSLLQSRLLDR
jgi:hypothetical protein